MPLFQYHKKGRVFVLYTAKILDIIQPKHSKNMKLTSIFFLGLGMTAVMASGDSYLRVNKSSRQLSDSNQSYGKIFHSMQRTLLGPLPPPVPPPPPPHPPIISSSGGSGGGDGSDGDDEGGDDEDEDGRAYEESAEEKSWYSDSSAASGGDGTDNASENSDYNGEDGIQEQYSAVNASENTDYNGDDATQEQYFANEYNGGGAGSAQNAGGSSAANVWPFLVAALVVGVVAAALVTLKKVSFALFRHLPCLPSCLYCVLLTNVVVAYSSKIIAASAN